MGVAIPALSQSCDTRRIPLTRDEAHRLVDTLDGADVPTAVALLRQLATARPLRDFRGFDLFDADEDLADRASEILRAGLGGTTRAQEGGAHTA